jgi:hypothetical protein
MSSYQRQGAHRDTYDNSPEGLFLRVHVAVVGRLGKGLLATEPTVDAVDTGANGQHVGSGWWLLVVVTLKWVPKWWWLNARRGRLRVCVTGQA